jgi:hypothetical protein
MLKIIIRMRLLQFLLRTAAIPLLISCDIMLSGSSLKKDFRIPATACGSLPVKSKFPLKSFK